ncbi:MAG TPA: class I SAM-dependent methyltransferase [Thermodesulfovibrionales bacterium]|nr:class I SAM-dependent methyltransferase [Thermodesulfovibrionales bacterium]
MSSPIASDKKGPVRTFLIRLHQLLSHNRRVDILAQRIHALINEKFGDSREIRCLDVGCGDMKISQGINRLNARTLWHCIDLYDLPPDLEESREWMRYQKYDGERIPFGDKSIDVVFFCDVLHHVKGDIPSLLKEASRVGSAILIKDHFEQSLYSRRVLQAMDFFGNWSYGVALPEHYFTRETFDELYRSCGLTLRKIETRIDLYNHLPIIRYLLKPEWHFIALLES